MLNKFIPLGSYGQWVAALVVTIASMASGIIRGWPNVVIPKLKDGSAGVTLTEEEISLLVAFIPIGAITSPLPTGYLMDLIGRKVTLVVMSSLGVLSWLIVASSYSVSSIYVGSYFLGTFFGFEFSAVFIYIGEVTEPRLRGTIASCAQLTFFCGSLFVSLLSPFHYLTVTIISMMPLLLLLIGSILIVPESPYYSLMKGDREQATKTLEWLRGEIQKEEVDTMENGVTEQMKNKGTFIDIFLSLTNLRSFLLIESFMVVNGYSAISLLSGYAEEIIPNSWVSSATGYSILTSVWIASVAVYISLMDKFDRKPVLYISIAGASVGYTATAIWYFLKDKTNVDTSNTNWVPLVTLVIVGMFEAGGFSVVPNVLKGEIFPMHIKTKCVGLSCMTMSLFEATNTYFFYEINNKIGMYFNFLKLLLTALFCAVTTKFLLVETRGKTLEEIQEIMKNRTSND